MAENSLNAHIISDCLIIPLPEDFSLDTLLLFQKNILGRINRHSVKKVLVDVSAINVMDRKTFTALVQTGKMICLMGGQTVFTGFKPGVASTLVDLSVDFDSLNIASDLEEGIKMLENTSPDQEKIGLEYTDV